jgi:branched-chain amino acid transport system substrate-binding protein
VDPIADQYKVLQVTAAANSPRLINASKYFLASVPNSTFEVQVGLTLAQKHFKFSKAAFIYRNDDLGNGVKDFFTNFWAKAGGQLLTVQSHEPTQADFTTLASKVAAAAPEFIYITSASATQGLLVKQLRQAGATMPIISGVGLAVTELFSVAGDASKDCYWTSPSSSLNPSAFSAFSSEYQAAYPGATLSTFTSQHYDVANAIFAAAIAVKKAGQPLDGAHIRDAMLAHGTFLGVQGPFTPHADGSCTRAEDIDTSINHQSTTFLTAKQVQDQGIYDFGLT